MNRFIFAFSMVCGMVVSSAAQADFMLTDKDNLNPVLIPSGATASSTYILETDYDDAFLPDADPGPVPGFRFNDNDGSSTLLTSPDSGTDLRQGFTQGLAGNEENGYVGTVVGKGHGNTLTLSLGAEYLTNGPGADLYVTSKNVDGSGTVQAVSTQDKSMAVGFRIVDGPYAGWHLYNPDALPARYQPAEGTPDANLGAIDLSDLKISATPGAFGTGDLAGIGDTIPLGTKIDKVILVNDNVANAWAFGYRADTVEAPTGFVARRDFDNADNDGDGFTGVDYLTGRYGDRWYNGQDAPQAWFVGLTNTMPVPEPASLALVGLGLAASVFFLRRKR